MITGHRDYSTKLSTANVIKIIFYDQLVRFVLKLYVFNVGIYTGGRGGSSVEGKSVIHACTQALDST